MGLRAGMDGWIYIYIYVCVCVCVFVCVCKSIICDVCSERHAGDVFAENFFFLYAKCN